MRVKMILPALMEAISPHFHPIKYSLVLAASTGWLALGGPVHLLAEWLRGRRAGKRDGRPSVPPANGAGSRGRGAVRFDQRGRNADRTAAGMHIKLIFPSRPMRPLEIRTKNHLIPSETLPALAAVTPRRHKVEIADENVAPIRLDDRPDLVGITVYTFLAPRAYAIADACRARGIPVALGGLHVTGRPTEALEHADFIFIGEADETWPRFLADFERGCARRVYRPSSSVNIAALARPRRDLLDQRRYLSTASVTATRGCPYSCAYCFNSVDPLYSRFRKRPVESVVQEIRRHQALRDNYIVFFDDNLMVDKAYGRALCRAIAPLGVRWRCASSIDLGYDEQTVRLMAESGCESVFIGLESINAASLAESAKHHNQRKDYEYLVDVFHRHRIMINASFVFGFDSDDPGVFARTVEFARDVKLASINFHILTPYPGTPLFQRLEQEARILTYDWRKYDTAHAVFQPRQMSPEQLETGYYKAYREFYRWSSILRRMPAALTDKPRFLAFNIALKKMNPLWDLMIRLNVLLPAFRAYNVIDRVLSAFGRGASNRASEQMHSLKTGITAKRFGIIEGQYI